MMASKEANGRNPTCLMCLETPTELKVVTGTCHHAFCRNCLAAFIEKLGSPQKVHWRFSCPACQATCPLPGNGVDGLLDYDPDSVEGKGDIGVDHKEQRQVVKRDESPLKCDVPTCQTCHFTEDKDVEAEYFCEECGCLFLCPDCKEVHGTNEATAGHVVTALRRRNEACCKVHRKLISGYCTLCSVPCCYICVLLNHGNHAIRKIGEEFRVVVDEVTALTEEQERRSTDVKRFARDLRFIQASDVVQRRDILLKEVEDQTEKYIAHALEKKEVLKKQIYGMFALRDEVSKLLENVPDVAELDKKIDQAKVMLTMAEPHPKDLEKLSVIKNEILDLGLTHDVDAEKYWESYESLRDQSHQFIPSQETVHLGKLESCWKPSETSLDRCVWSLLFEKHIEPDDHATTISAVTNLGNDTFALGARPTDPGDPRMDIYIHKLSTGELQRSFQVNVGIDIAAAPDGNLAVLSDGSTENTYSVRLFHPVTGYIKSTKDLSVHEPLSFDINGRYQYIVLSKEGGRRISVFDTDGALDITCQIDESLGIHDAFKLSCSFKHIFVMGEKRIVSYGPWRYYTSMYGRRKKEILVVISSTGSSFRDFSLVDISVTGYDDVYLSYHNNCVPKAFKYGWYTHQKLSGDRKSATPKSGATELSVHSLKNEYLITVQDVTMVRVYRRQAKH